MNDTSFTTMRLFWVGVIALIAGILTTWLRTESLPMAVGLGAAAAVISMGIIWFVGRTHRD